MSLFSDLNSLVPAKFKAFLGLIIVVQVAAACAGLWLTGSLVTSGVKAVSGSCGKTYPVEKVVSGNWFCAE